MTVQHRGLAGGRWQRLSLAEQMANVGSEVERALNWRARGNDAYRRAAFERALELLDLTLADARRSGRRREIARCKEALIDFFAGPNAFASSDESWRRYFLAFGLLCRKDR